MKRAVYQVGRRVAEVGAGVTIGSTGASVQQPDESEAEAASTTSMPSPNNDMDAVDARWEIVPDIRDENFGIQSLANSFFDNIDRNGVLPSSPQAQRQAAKVTLTLAHNLMNDPDLMSQLARDLSMVDRTETESSSSNNSDAVSRISDSDINDNDYSTNVFSWLWHRVCRAATVTRSSALSAFNAIVGFITNQENHASKQAITPLMTLVIGLAVGIVVLYVLGIPRSALRMLLCVPIGVISAHHDLAK